MTEKDKLEEISLRLEIVMDSYELCLEEGYDHRPEDLINDFLLFLKGLQQIINC